MKERPILFSGSMVRAILAGTKTQDRRVVKPQPGEGAHVETMRASLTRSGSKPVFAATWDAPSDDGSTMSLCPYGQPGTKLWVRETWAVPHRYDGHGPSNIPVLGVRTHYAATEERGGLRWRPSIHMPRWASRITLEITGVRVERLHDISEADAMAEGVNVHPDHHGKPRTSIYSPVQAYRALWESINGQGSWAVNPWVWVISFHRLEANNGST